MKKIYTSILLLMIVLGNISYYKIWKEGVLINILYIYHTILIWDN